MTQSPNDNAHRVRLAFDGRLPHARWGPLFHVFRTCLVWRSGDDRPAIRALVDLASAWTRVNGDTR